jgi:hypothetical protein
MALPVEINPLQLKTSGGYSINKSLRFRSSASAYLNRTPSVAGSRQKFTISAWLKRGTNPSTGQILMAAGTGTLNQDCYLCFGGSNTTGGTADTLCFFSPPAGNNISLLSTALYRDFSAWYHIVVAVDTTQATASNRVLMYVNGVQITSFTTATYPTLNQNLNFNNTTAQQFATSTVTPANFFDGYLAEVNFIDGQALTPSSFGAYDTNGVWQPAKYSGTYGTNGFYLPFTNTTSTATLGNDSSGNGNTWTVNNISLTAGTTYDSMTDSPTVTSASVANYAVMNPLNGQTSTLSNGNLSMAFSSSGGTQIRVGTVGISSGKWYWEGNNIYASGAQDPYFGIVNSVGGTNGQTTVNPDGSSNAWALIGSTASGVQSSNGATKNLIFSGVASGDIYMVAIDADAGKIWFGKNGSWAAGSVPSTGTGPQWSNLNTPPYFALFRGSGAAVSGTINANFGQQPFSYTPPTGFNALNTYNLPAPSITNGAKYFAASTYTGNLTGQTITNGGNNTIGTTFQPDLVWVKSRSAATDYKLTDAVRGATKALISNTTGAETTDTTGLTAFASNGFTLGVSTVYNNTGATYAAWQWLANGAGSSNTNGSSTSTVSANTTAGFSVVTYTGTAANATVGHGLGVAPNLIITKNRDGVTDWWVYHSSLGATQYLVLDSAAAAVTSASAWNNTAPTSTVFSLGAASPSNANRDIAYCWTAVPGYSAFGSYTGNASTDGPFVYCGFRPRFVLLKNTAQSADWFIVDTSRNTSNAATNYLEPDNATAEASGVGDNLDFLSNGFKIKTTNLTTNGSGNTIIYAAFAENPFNSSRAR